MLTYVIRRLLYSVVVLVAASMLVFVFVTAVWRPAGRAQARAAGVAT